MMPNTAPNQLNAHGLRLGRLGLGTIALTLLLTACGEDAIVYPNRNLRPPSAGETGDSGAAGQAGEAGAEIGGAPQGGSEGAKGGSGGRGGTGGKGGSAGSGGAPVVGPVCGDKKVEAPEECDDGNTLSGDGCSWDCKSACEICEQKVCPAFDGNLLPPSTASAYDDCYKALGKIAKGPATSYPRAQVCQELVDCIRQEACAQTKGPLFDPKRCWCDTDWNNSKGDGGLPPTQACVIQPDPANPKDPTKFIPGKCASLFQDAAELPGLSDVVKKLVAVETAEGAALRLLTACDSRECTEECLPSYFTKGGIATITGDIAWARNVAGESALGDLVADSHRAIAVADFALVSSGFIPAEFPPDLKFEATPYRAADAPGRVLWSEAVLVNWGHSESGNFGKSQNTQANSTLLKATFTGQQIYDALNQQFAPAVGGQLHVSGLRYEWDAAQPIESRIVNVFKDGSQTPLDKTATFSVAVTDFLTGTSSLIPALKQGASATVVPNAQVSEILGEYLKQLPQPVAPPELNRVKRFN